MIPRFLPALWLLLALVASAQERPCEYVPIADSSHVANFNDARGLGSCGWCCLAMLGRHDGIGALREPLGSGPVTFGQLGAALTRRGIPHRRQSFNDREASMKHLADCIAARRPVMVGIWTFDDEGVRAGHAIVVCGIDARHVWYIDPNDTRVVRGMDRKAFARTLSGPTLYLVKPPG